MLDPWRRKRWPLAVLVCVAFVSGVEAAGWGFGSSPERRLDPLLVAKDSALRVCSSTAAAASPVAPPPQEAAPPVANEFGGVPLFDLPLSQAARPPAEAAPPKPKPLGFGNRFTRPLPVLENTVPYDGIEYRWGNLRIRPAELKVEGLLLLGAFVVIAWGLMGRSSNRKRATSLWDTLQPWLESEFAQVGEPDAPGALTSDGPQSYLGVATGRRGCSSLTTRVELRPRQDPLSLFYELLRTVLDAGWTGNDDRVTLEWRIAPRIESGLEVGEFEPKDAWVFAIVNKREMNNLRSQRFDIRMFTEVKETPLLPPKFALMSESGDITDALLKRKDTGVVDLLTSSPEALKYLDSFIISGTRATDPLDADLPLPSNPRLRHVTLSLRLPEASSVSLLLPIFQASARVVDALDRNLIAIPSIAASKVVKRRQEVSDSLLAASRKEEDEAKEEARRKKLKAAADEKLSKMTPAQQEKYRERERKRGAQKAQQKMATKRK